MEIETIEIESHGDKIIIPEGYKVIINGNEIVFEKDKNEFKDGDVLVSNDKYERFPLIFKGNDNKGFHKFYARLGYYENLIICKKDVERCGNSGLSLATEEEKQLLFDKMKEQGLRWNAEEKRVEKIRWEAEDGEKYYYVFSTTDVNDTTHCNRLADRLRVGNGNCFRTEKQAGEAAERVKETLRKFHEEIGE